MKYVIPEMEILHFDTMDIVCGSPEGEGDLEIGGDGGVGGGGTIGGGGNENEW